MSSFVSHVTKVEMSGYIYFALLPVVMAAAAQDVQKTIRAVQEKEPDIFMGTEELVRRSGYPIETHTVMSSDGYFTDIHRIPGRGYPIYLQHGFLCSSDLWILEGPGKGLGYILADLGYDVWMGNSRGNTYSKRNVNLDSTNVAFWKFSWHEMGVYDLSAAFDYILNTTGYEQLYYVGHSMGNAMGYALLSERPEYNTKIRLFLALAPAVIMGQTRSLITRTFQPYIDMLTEATDNARLPEVLPFSPSRAAFGYLVCRDGSQSQPQCVDFFEVAYGFSNGLNKTRLPLYLSHFLAGTSIRTFQHFLQIIESDSFRRFDYGPEENVKVYHSMEPPEYNLAKVTAPSLLVYSDADVVVDSRDVLRLSKRLPRAKLYRVPAKLFNHIDHILHADVRSLLYDHVLKFMASY